MAAFGKNKAWNFPEDEKLFNLGYWAGFIGWVVLVLGAAEVAMTFIQMSQSGGIDMWVEAGTPIALAAVIYGNSAPLMSAIFFWFILQAVKQLLYAMIDVKDLLSDGEIESEE